MTDYAVAIVATNREWAGRVARHFRDFGPALADQIAEPEAAFDRTWQVLLIDAGSVMTNAGFVGGVHAQGRAVLGVWHADDPNGKRSCLSAGVNDVIESGATVAEFVAALQTLVAALPAQPADGQDRARTRRPPARPSQRRAGLLLAVGGPVGSDPEPVVLGLARTLAKRGKPALVVDANELCPSLAQLLGLPHVPNLASAVAAERTGGNVDSHLQTADGFYVLAGLADPAQWVEAPARSVLSLVSAMAARFTYTVAAVGPVAEPGERFATTRTLLLEADAVVAIGRASPEGITRLTMWVADMRSLAPTTPLYLAAHRAPRVRYRQADVIEKLREIGKPAGVFLLPTDERQEKAAWQGTPVRRGSMLRSIAHMAEQVAPVRKGRR